MDSPWLDGYAEGNSEHLNPRSERHGLLVANGELKFGTFCANDIEQQIFRHQDSEAHYGAITSYLQMDLETLQSILFLREISRHCTELAKLHESFFTSPPKELFKLIYDLRLFNDYSAAKTVRRFESFRRAARQDQQDRQSKCTSGQKTAPKGMAYKCPSENCKKTYNKLGHASNHVATLHPEYLKLYPGWEPRQDLISCPGSLSPILDDGSPLNVADAEQEQWHVKATSKHIRSHKKGTSIASFEAPDLNDISPRSLGFSSTPGEGDGRSRRNSRPSPFLPATPPDPDMPSAYTHYAQAASPCMKRQRSPGCSAELLMLNQDYDAPNGSKPSAYDNGTGVSRRHSYKIRR